MSSAEGAARRRGRPPADEAIESSEILDAALRAFARHGLEGVSVRTLNRELGVSHNLIYQPFGSKNDLWRAAVDYGFGGAVSFLQSVWDPTLTDPLEQLRLLVRSMVIWSADHPEMLALMDIEGRQDTERLAYIYTTYIAPSLAPVERLLDYLVAEGRIRAMPLRTLHFLVLHGAIAPFTLVPLARHFDRGSPLRPRAVREHADLVADVIVRGLCL